MIGIFARGDRLGVALALAVILLLTTALATTISVIQTNDLSNKGVPVATHWSSPECANGFSSSPSLGLPLGLFLGLGLGFLLLAFVLRLIPLEYMNLGTEGLKKEILARRDLRPKVYNMVTIMLLAIGIPTVLFTFLMLLPANDWNVKCSKSAQCVQAVRTALDTGSSDKICCGQFADFGCPAWWGITFWLFLALVITTPVALTVLWIGDMRKMVQEVRTDHSATSLGSGLGFGGKATRSYTDSGALQ